MNRSLKEDHVEREIAQLEEQIAAIGQPVGFYQERMLILYRNLLTQKKKALDKSCGRIRGAWEDYLRSHYR